MIIELSSTSSLAPAPIEGSDDITSVFPPPAARCATPLPVRVRLPGVYAPVAPPMRYSPPATLTALLAGMAELVTINKPALTAVFPVYVLVPETVHVPEPLLLSDTVAVPLEMAPVTWLPVVVPLS